MQSVEPSDLEPKDRKVDTKYGINEQSNPKRFVANSLVDLHKVPQIVLEVLVHHSHDLCEEDYHREGEGRAGADLHHTGLDFEVEFEFELPEGLFNGTCEGLGLLVEVESGSDRESAVHDVLEEESLGAED